MCNSLGRTQQFSGAGPSTRCLHSWPADNACAAVLAAANLRGEVCHAYADQSIEQDSSL